MRKLLVAILILAISACATSQPQRGSRVVYQPTLVSIEHQERGGSYRELSPTGLNTFHDERIAITWRPQITQLEFGLTNRSSGSIRVLWDDASFVGVDGRADRMMHAGVKFADRSASMPPTTIIRGATLDDLVAPASNVYWQEGLGRWQSRPLVLPGIVPQADTVLKVLLPIAIGSAVYEYVFIFSLAEARQVDPGIVPAQITIVRNEADVAQCKLLGEIAAHPPYVWPGDDFKQLRRKAAELGANTVLVPGSRLGTVEGFAYQCKPKR
jgi:hypothetical protein